MSNHVDWWRGAIIYQIYPRSFYDSNNDGIGDLAGITQKLDYVADLGVDGIWISPFFKSPMKDFGYDISDYRDVDPIFGNNDDFDDLLEKAHSLNLKVIIDLAFSHTSEEHPWFLDETKKDWYVWADAKHDKDNNRVPPNNWVSVFGGSAWEWCEQREKYYFHNFLKEQPDLNFHNLDVQSEIIDICKYWLDRGIDGIRLDVVNFYFHDPLLRDNPPRQSGAKFATQFEKETPYSTQQHIYDKSRPENLDFIAKLRALTDQYSDRVLVGEIGDDHPYKLAQEYTNGKNHLHTCYNPHMMSGTQKTLTEDLVRVPIETFFAQHSEVNNLAESVKESSAWPSWAFSNHDVVRAQSRWYKPYSYNNAFSKMLIALLGCLPGTAFIFQGEELGLPEAKIAFKNIQDPWAKETYPQWQGRDGCRTPMIWDNSIYCGFSQTLPWLPIPKAHHILNIQTQNKEKTSVLNFTKEFIHWRKIKPEIINGNHEFIETSNSNIIDLRRYNSSNETHCIFNLSCVETQYKGQKYAPYAFHIDEFKEP
ncbi:MAG: alpha-glucosidase [Alphaproteobacteria bacterium]|nr:MAG: alpha-glucosidase [Alphaproteobacteria bacterium]